MFYLRIEDGSFGFAVDGVHVITKTDIPITDEEYAEFFRRQGVGECFRLKKERPESGGLFDYIEPFEMEQPEHTTTPFEELEQENQQLKLALAEAIEKQETDKIEQQLAQAEMFETILQMLEPQGGGE
ncbi:hypothetical protein [Eubacterium callanderi]|uniref:Uncharacterized protein n=1 Tax=Eubacterium callanderi TaxID=53442 RepID=A0A853JU52_9FIRM|nr:hypothetical protein [Eubacterium callanderi]